MKLLPFPLGVGNENEQVSYYNHQVYLGFVFDSRVPISGKESLWSYVDSDRISHYYYQVPVMQQYFSWLRNIFLHWDWGVSNKLMSMRLTLF